jgi:hypothetical protein
MQKTYKRVSTYYCLGTIYRQGLAFGEAGRTLIESGQTNLFVPGVVNICLATEIFLKSINAKTTNLEDEVERNGVTMYVGRDETLSITPGGRGHILSRLFDDLPADARAEIAMNAQKEGFAGDVSKGLCRYDDVFVDWRYIYEKNDPAVLGTHPLLQICNAIEGYCRKYQDKHRDITSDTVA